jgi:hypothetical protein
MPHFQLQSPYVCLLQIAIDLKIPVFWDTSMCKIPEVSNDCVALPSGSSTTSGDCFTHTLFIFRVKYSKWRLLYPYPVVKHSKWRLLYSYPVYLLGQALQVEIALPIPCLSSGPSTPSGDCFTHTVYLQGQALQVKIALPIPCLSSGSSTPSADCFTHTLFTITVNQSKRRLPHP